MKIGLIDVDGHNFPNANEKWLPVKELVSFDSRWRIKDKYTFPDGKYYVSDKGRFMRDGKICFVKKDNVGTYTYCLEKHRFKLHQIVLQTFLPEGIRDGYSPDHIDKNRDNNSLTNLRWANMKTQVENRENKEHKYKKVLCKENKKIYKSCQHAEKDLELVKNTVSRVARGERDGIHGYHFEYID